MNKNVFHCFISENNGKVLEQEYWICHNQRKGLRVSNIKK